MPPSRLHAQRASCEFRMCAGIRRISARYSFEIDRPAGQQRDAFRRERFVFLLPELQEVGVEDDVGIENLAGRRVHARGAHRKAGARRDPAERVVANVARLPR